MKAQFCIIGATRGTGLLITQRLLQAGASVRILARNPDRARWLLGKRADIRHGDVTDAQSLRDAIAEDYRAIFFAVAATGGIDGRAEALLFSVGLGAEGVGLVLLEAVALDEHEVGVL